jgi:hypothetical protein
MNTAKVKNLGNSVLRGGALWSQCFASGRFRVYARPLWHSPRPNPSVKGTSTSGLRPLVAAPYLER